MNTTGKVFGLLFSTLLILCTGNAPAQEAVKLRSALSAGGSSGIYTSKEKVYFIQHCTGQQSLTGTAAGREYLLRQGYIQPPDPAHRIMPLIKSLPVTVYPNPMSDHLNISLTDLPEETIIITILDLRGTPVLQKNCKNDGEIELDLSSLPPAVYTLKISAASRSFHSRIIKL